MLKKEVCRDGEGRDDWQCHHRIVWRTSIVRDAKEQVIGRTSESSTSPEITTEIWFQSTAPILVYFSAASSCGWEKPTRWAAGCNSLPLIAAELLRHTENTLPKTQRRILASPLLPLPVEQDNGKTTSRWSEGFGDQSARLLGVSDTVFRKRLGSVRPLLCVCLRKARVPRKYRAAGHQSQSGLCQALSAMPGFFVDVWATLSTLRVQQLRRAGGEWGAAANPVFGSR